MMGRMNRTALQELAEVRLREAAALLAVGLWDGAYYLAGYAVECGLKSCVLNYIAATGVIFREKDYARKDKGFFTHSPNDLLKLAGLDPELGIAVQSDPTLGTNWDVVKEWTEQARYARHAEVEAKTLYDAITDPTHGVLTWIKRHW
jgi:hypothetical protein